MPTNSSLRITQRVSGCRLRRVFVWRCSSCHHRPTIGVFGRFCRSTKCKIRQTLAETWPTFLSPLSLDVAPKWKAVSPHQHPCLAGVEECAEGLFSVFPTENLNSLCSSSSPFITLLWSTFPNTNAVYGKDFLCFRDQGGLWNSQGACMCACARFCECKWQFTGLGDI